MSDAAPESRDTAPVIVLVVEDEQLIQESLGTALEEAGFAVIFASNGGEALQSLEQEGGDPVRALVTDVDLGTEITGWNVAKRARELHPDMAVAYITGGSADEWSAHGVPKSILITKPFAPAQVVTA